MKLLRKISLLSLPALFLPSLSLAATLANPLGESDLRLIIGNLIQSLLGLVGVIALVMFVWGGMQWMLSMGDSKKVEKGKQTLIYAFMGLVVIFTAYTLVSTLIKAITSQAG
jgi:hypothetical protein